MNKLLTILLLSVSMNLYAYTVLDSEQTDFEFEFESCDAMGTDMCQNKSVFNATSEFYPVTAFGFYTTGPSWYWGPHGLRFNPTPIYGSRSYVPALVK